MKYSISSLIMNNEKLHYSDNDKLKLRKKANHRNAFIFCNINGPMITTDE